MEKKFFESVKQNDLFAPREKVLVAVSGGPDSVALLHLLSVHGARLNIFPYVVHMHHNLRGKDADKDAKYVEELAKKLGIPITIKKVDIPAISKEQGSNIEEAGRNERYKFFAEVAGRVGAKKVAVAHNANDQVETYLMRLTRGAGTKGLSAMKPLTQLKDGLLIVRPLLQVWRSEIEEYINIQKLKPRIDKTNFLNKYFRNRTRHELIPYLERLNPKVKEKIFQSAELARHDEAYFSALTQKLLKDKNIFKLKTLAKLEFSLLSRALLKAIEEAKGDLREIEYVHITAIIDKLQDNYPWELHLPAGIYAISDGTKLTLTRKKPQEKRIGAFTYRLKIPGVTYIPEVKAKIEAIVIKGNKMPPDSSGFSAYFDLGKCGRGIRLRNFREGDHFVPLGMTGRKKLSDLFIDAKVPRLERKKIPLLGKGGKVLWVAGYRIDDRFKVDNKTKKILGVKLID
ncbi:MAG: tRNA lysidine(34) synthetase TilS [bacterium]